MFLIFPTSLEVFINAYISLIVFPEFSPNKRGLLTFILTLDA